MCLQCSACIISPWIQLYREVFPNTLFALIISHYTEQNNTKILSYWIYYGKGSDNFMRTTCRIKTVNESRAVFRWADYVRSNTTESSCSFPSNHMIPFFLSVICVICSLSLSFLISFRSWCFIYRILFLFQVQTVLKKVAIPVQNQTEPILVNRKKLELKWGMNVLG